MDVNESEIHTHNPYIGDIDPQFLEMWFLLRTQINNHILDLLVLVLESSLDLVELGLK